MRNYSEIGEESVITGHVDFEHLKSIPARIIESV